VTCEASNEDPALCIEMQHAACKRPHVLNSDSPTVDQPVPQWHILPIMGVPVPDKDAYVNQEEFIKEEPTTKATINGLLFLFILSGPKELVKFLDTSIDLIEY
jgi:hypothetical protein